VTITPTSMPKILRRAYAIALLAALPACSSQINYSLNTVPEESGARFAQITTQSDQAMGPLVRRTGENGLHVPTTRWFDLSPDGNVVAFLGKKNDKQNVYLKGTQGGVSTTQRTFRDNVWDPAISSDGKHVAFVDFRNNRWNVFEVNANQGAAVRQITNFDQVSQSPSYSPAGHILVFVQDEHSTVGTMRMNGQPGSPVGIVRQYIWEVDLDKNSFTQLAEGFSPAFSPDGKKLAITRNSRDNGNTEIWVIDVENGTESLVAGSKDQGFIEPSFSPDGKKIAFAGSSTADKTRPANWDIFMVDADGGSKTQLTFHPGHDVSPHFGPDGKSVYFLSQRGNELGDWNVWRMEFAR
jgi:Tol biopolymer transport system component